MLERNVLIARDVVEALHDLDPTARVVAARSLDEALRRTEELPHLSAAFLAMPYEWVRRSGLGARVESLGGRVILFDGQSAAAPQAHPGWLSLPRPFTSEIIQAAARGALSDRSGCGAATA